MHSSLEKPMFATLEMWHAAAHSPSRLLRAWRDALFRAPEPTAAARAATHEIARQRILRVPAALGQRIECLEGCVWVTMDHDRRDVIIEAGQFFTADRRQRVLVHALAPSRVRLIQPVC
jgi:hypothetical protein